MEIIKTINLTKIFSPSSEKKRVAALTDVSLEVTPGEIFGLLGPNGAGKTTFIRILLSIIYPTGGSATMFGENVGNHEVKTRVGYLPENHRFPSYMTGNDVLRFFGKLGRVPERELDARIDGALELVEMTRWRKTKIRQYSKGMMQRLGIAQALLARPDLVILDEPTDGVDPLGRKHIREILLRLKDEGKTVFLNSHLLSEVEMVCDRVAILNKGRVVQTAGIEELTTSSDRFIITTLRDLPTGFAFQSQDGFRTLSNAGTKVVIATDSIPALNSAIDQLRARGIEIVEIARERHSLEEMFINVIAQDNNEPSHNS